MNSPVSSMNSSSATRRISISLHKLRSHAFAAGKPLEPCGQQPSIIVSQKASEKGCSVVDECAKSCHDLISAVCSALSSLTRVCLQHRQYCRPLSPADKVSLDLRILSSTGCLSHCRKLRGNVTFGAKHCFQMPVLLTSQGPTKEDRCLIAIPSQGASNPGYPAAATGKHL